ncbi:MAG: TIGR00268 family protein, partial [Planctomycetota bacterium JB042]
GYRTCRLRHHDDVARLELSPEDLPNAVTRDREPISKRLRELGWTHVAVDLRGYRSGSLNEGSKESRGEQREQGRGR